MLCCTLSSAVQYIGSHGYLLDPFFTTQGGGSGNETASFAAEVWGACLLECDINYILIVTGRNGTLFLLNFDYVLMHNHLVLALWSHQVHAPKYPAKLLKMKLFTTLETCMCKQLL